jgi:hypothetical protein
MSARYDKLLRALKRALPAVDLEELGRSVRFIRRLRTVFASALVFALVMSRFSAEAPGFETGRQWLARLGSALVGRRPFQMRFKVPAVVALFEGAFDIAVRSWRRGTRFHHPLAKLFRDVVAIDSTIVALSDQLQSSFKGTGKKGDGSGKASLKVLLAMSVFGRLPLFAEVVAGSVHDANLFPSFKRFAETTLLLFDKGFFKADLIHQLVASHVEFLCPLPRRCNPTIVAVNRAPRVVRSALARQPDGVRLRELLDRRDNVRAVWDVLVRLKRNGPAVRMVVEPGRKLHRPYVTSIAPETCRASSIAEIYRLRWQIELVFKELKQDLNLASVPTKDAHAAQAFVWASLIALAVSRVVCAAITPSFEAGLLAHARPALVSRALRSFHRLVGRALVSGRAAPVLLRIVEEEIVAELRAFGRSREDTFSRLIPLLSAA